MPRAGSLTLDAYLSKETSSSVQFGFHVFPGNHKPDVLVDSKSRTKIFAKLSPGPMMASVELV